MNTRNLSTSCLVLGLLVLAPSASPAQNRLQRAVIGLGNRIERLEQRHHQRLARRHRPRLRDRLNVSARLQVRRQARRSLLQQVGAQLGQGSRIKLRARLVGAQHKRDGATVFRVTARTGGKTLERFMVRDPVITGPKVSPEVARWQIKGLRPDTSQHTFDGRFPRQGPDVGWREVQRPAR